MIHKYKTISTIISFLLLSFSLLVVIYNPAIGYETSTYYSTPIIFWIAIIFGLLNGFYLITSELYSKLGKMWKIGIFQIALCNCLVISLYALRGYVTLRNDPMTLVGLANDIYNYGFFGDNIYPISSIIIVILSRMIEVPLIIISNYLSSIFIIIYLISIYYWSKSIIPDSKYVLCSLIAASPIFFAWFTTSIYPMLLSVLTIPFFLYCLQRNTDYRFRIISIIFCLIYPYFHPITAILIFLYLVTIFMCERFWLKRGEKNHLVSTTLIMTSFVAMTTWFIWQYKLFKNMKYVLLQVFGLLNRPTTLTEAQYYLFKLGIITSLKSLFLMVIDEIVFYILTLIVFFYILKDRRYKKTILPIAISFTVGSLFILVCSIAIRLHSPIRFINLNPNLMLTPPLVGYLIYTLLSTQKKVKSLLVISLIGLSTIIAVFSLYTSPITVRPNRQVTKSDVKGMNFLINYKKTTLKTVDITSPVFRFADLIYGTSFSEKRKDLTKDLNLNDHFGFTENNIFPIDEDRYLVLTEFDIISYTKVWKQLDRFSEEDFIKVDLCINVNKIYDNRKLYSYLILK